MLAIFEKFKPSYSDSVIFNIFMGEELKEYSTVQC